jgi:predicted DNA-binding transcriptional regulator YafY
MNRSDRLFGILLLLQKRRRVRAADLAAQFEVSERTIYRDMAAIAETGVPLVSLPGAGYELAEGFYLPPLLFTPDQAGALFLAAKLLKAHATGRLAAETETALTKLTVVLPASVRQEIEPWVEMFQFWTPPAPFDLDDTRLATLQRAIRECRVVRLRYHSLNRNETTTREVDPYHLAYYNGAWYVSGYCHLRQDTRAFRVDRIDDLRLLGETFEPRPVVATPGEPVMVRIRFAAGVVRWVRERQHYGFQGEEALAGGDAVMAYCVDQVSELKPWVLGWGAGAEVLEPPEFRDEIRQEVLKMLKFLT